MNLNVAGLYSKDFKSDEQEDQRGYKKVRWFQDSCFTIERVKINKTELYSVTFICQL